MSARYVGPRFENVAPRWHDLAKRRLAYYAELYRSGRWRRYYTEERFLLRMRDVIRAVRLWGELAGETPGAAVEDWLRPAA
jgi:uncharacterized repeat protein (TIGR03809 family)